MEDAFATNEAMPEKDIPPRPVADESVATLAEVYLILLTSIETAPEDDMLAEEYLCLYALLDVDASAFIAPDEVLTR